MDEYRIDEAQEKKDEENVSVQELETTVKKMEGKTKLLSLLEKSKAFCLNRKPVSISVAVGLVVILAAAIILPQLSPENVAEKYVEASLFGDYSKQKGIMAYDLYAYILGDRTEEEYFEEKSDELKEDIQSWSDLSKYRREETEEELLDELGEYRIEIEATRTKEMSLRRMEEDLGSWIRLLESKAEFDKDQVTDAKEVSVKIKLSGEDEIERGERTVYLVKIGFFWKVLSGRTY